MALCAKCGAELKEGVGFCGSCGTPVGAAAGGAAAPAAPASTSGGLASNVGGALAYVTIIPAILFLVMEPYNKDKFIRFHSFQSLFFGIAWIVVWIGCVIVSGILAMIPVIGWIISILLWLVIGFGGFVLWLLLVYKAYNNQKWMLPVIGKLADQQAAK